MKRLFFTFAAIVFAVSVSAQQMPPIPVDGAVRIGKLDNGLTYYIRHHEEPAGQANFYIAQKVGSVLEDENQRGLAHFLEHMCFNGTDKFPGNGIIKYCESIGVRFGADLNAYTSYDETVYNIDNVPVVKVPSAIDSCLWILHDWADGLLLTDEDIDHERGVIHEEWRTRMNAALRQYETIMPVIFPGNRYGCRFPIGLMDVVDNFPYQVLRDYYEKWYRPDQQGIVVVGDVNVDQVESKIKDIFGSIATPENPAVREYFPVEDNQEPIVVLAKDKEQPNAIAFIFCKHDPVPDAQKTTMDYLVYSYALDRGMSMLNARIQEMLQKPNPPFIASQIDDDDFFVAKTKKAYCASVVFQETEFKNAVSAVYREMLRAVRGGFTESEYERSRAQYLADVESSYNQRDKKKSASFCREYVRHFIDNEPIAGIENIYQISKQLAPNIPVEVINQVFSTLAKDNNLVVAAMLPDKEGVTYPSEAEVAEMMKAVYAENIEPYAEEVSNEPLVKDIAKPGKVKKTSDSILGFKQYRLSNGVNVYIKKTDFNADQILMTAKSMGGLSLYPESNELKVINELLGIGGLGSFNNTELKKVLAGKKVSVNRSINLFSETVSGKSTPKDFETMLQLSYLCFTAPRSDEEAYESWAQRTKASLLNVEVHPNSALQDSVVNAIYATASRMRQIKADEVDAIDYAKAMEIANQRFANAADFNFVFTGNIDEEVALPLIEKYIGSLPSNKKRETFNADAMQYRTGEVFNQFDRPMEIPSVTSLFFENAPVKYSYRKDVAFDLALRALTVVLLEEIREKEGGTYGIGAYGSASKNPREEAYFEIGYQTSPDRYEYLNKRVNEIVEKFVSEGPSEENLSKGKEFLLKDYQEKLKENNYFLGAFLSYLTDGINIVDGYEDMVNGITAEDARQAFAEVYDAGNHACVIMHGVEAVKTSD